MGTARVRSREFVGLSMCSRNPTIDMATGNDTSTGKIFAICLPPPFQGEGWGGGDPNNYKND
jgi:hypothetical protein